MNIQVSEHAVVYIACKYVPEWSLDDVNVGYMQIVHLVKDHGHWSWILSLK